MGHEGAAERRLEKGNVVGEAAQFIFIQVQAHIRIIFKKDIVCMCVKEPSMRSLPFKAFKDISVLDMVHLVTNLF